MVIKGETQLAPRNAALYSFWRRPPNGVGPAGRQARDFMCKAPLGLSPVWDLSFQALRQLFRGMRGAHRAVCRKHAISTRHERKLKIRKEKVVKQIARVTSGKTAMLKRRSIFSQTSQNGSKNNICTTIQPAPCGVPCEPCLQNFPRARGD